MANFQLAGSPEPFLLVDLQKGEKIFCESDAMVMMEANLELGGSLRGGLFQSFMRRFTTGESLFQQEIKASFGNGQCLLSPNLDGDMQILDIGQNQYVLSDGAFVAATEHVNVSAKVQTNIGGSLFGGNGGFVVMETAGQGQLCISGCGTLLEVDVSAQNGETTIDNGLGNLFNSVTSGEGMVLKFRGNGKVVICSRNRKNYVTWLASVLNLNNNSR